MRALMVVLLLAMPAAAQEFGEHPVFQTRFGLLDVAQNEWDQTLRLNGQRLEEITDYRVVVQGAWGTVDPDVDWVLVLVNHSGNMCPYRQYLLRLSAGETHISPDFGECLGGPEALRVTAVGVEVDLSHPDLAISHTTFAYDGTGFSSHDTPATLGTGDPASSDPRQWIGTHPSVPLGDPAEQARFLAIMSADTLQTLDDRIGPANSVIERQGWVLGRGCQPHACNVAAGAWGIRLADGAPAVALVESGRAPVLFGAHTDPVFAQWTAEAQAGMQ